MATMELFPAPMTWPMLTGTSLYVGLGETKVPFMVPEGYPYLMKELVVLSDDENELEECDLPRRGVTGNAGRCADVGSFNVGVRV
jgi:hypothetical protein